MTVTSTASPASVPGVSLEPAPSPAPGGPATGVPLFLGYWIPSTLPGGTAAFVAPQLFTSWAEFSKTLVVSPVEQGLAVPTGVGFTKSIGGGRARVDGTVVEVAASPQTFPPQKDVYRDLAADGSWSFFSAAVGAAPAPPLAHRLRVGVTTTDAAGVIADRFVAAVDPYLVAAVRGFFECGGRRCWVLLLRDQSGWGSESAPGAALRSLRGFADFDLLCAPSLAQETAATVVAVQKELLQFCNDPQLLFDGVVSSDNLGARRFGTCFAVLDAVRAPQLTSDGNLDQVKQLRERFAPTPLVLRNAGLYHPWVRTNDGSVVPPCGHVAGLIAGSDAASGPFKAPANLELLGVVDLATPVSDADQQRLVGVNCLRAFPGRGIRVWGARTLLAALDPQPPASDVDRWSWMFINVQRLFVTVRRWLEREMAWAVFEPNDLSLWNQVTRRLTVYLNGLFLAGALKGRTPAEAYYVKCDAENNPPDQLSAGRLVVELGLAPVVPGEFIKVQLTQSTDATTVAPTQ
jgi:Bacteriophage tail sheath protein